MTFTVWKLLHVLFFYTSYSKDSVICGFAAHVSNVFSVLHLKLPKATFQSVVVVVCNSTCTLSYCSENGEYIVTKPH